MMNYLSRNKSYVRVELNKDARKIYIFCEGQKREALYFKYFQGFSSNIEIIPIPSEDGLSDPLKLLESAKAKFFSAHTGMVLDESQGDQVWFVIDTDRWNEGRKIEILANFCKANNTSQKRLVWFVAQSNPCFEIWLFFHFFDKHPDLDEIQKARSFKHFVDQKIPGGFDHRKMPIRIEVAINNAEALCEIENDQPCYLSTNVYFLGKVMLPYIKPQLDLILKGRGTLAWGRELG